MIFHYIHDHIIILSPVYNEPTQWPAPRGLVSLIGRGLHRYCTGQGIKSHTSLNFFRLSFCNCKRCVCNCDVHFPFNNIILHPTVLIYDFLYINNWHEYYSTYYNVLKLILKQWMQNVFWSTLLKLVLKCFFWWWAPPFISSPKIAHEDV